MLFAEIALMVSPGWCVVQASAQLTRPISHPLQKMTGVAICWARPSNTCFVSVISFNPHTIQRDGNAGPCFTDEEMELLQRGEMTCPRSQAMTESGLTLRAGATVWEFKPL